jgi:hypothetical protein
MQRVHVDHFKLTNGRYAPFLEDGRQVLLCAQPGAQEAFLAAPEKEVCLGGPRGPGKTLIMLSDYLQDVGAGWGAAWKGIVFRRSMTGFAELKSLAEQYISQIFPDAAYNQNQSFWRFATGETLKLAYFDEALDYTIYQGASYTWQGWEELTQWDDDKALRMMLATLRSTVPGIPLRVRATTNPDGVGHNWVKARYQASDYHALGDYLIGPRIEADDTGPARRMIYAKLVENQLLLRVDPSYLASIKAAAVDEGKFEGWVNGSWEILSGDLFGDLWPAAKPYATLPSFTVEAIPQTWRIDRCLDWGDSAPFSVLWFAESDGSPIVWNGRKFNFIRGDIVLFMEWFGQGRQPNTGLRLSTPQLRDGIIEREIDSGLRWQDHTGKWRSRVHAGAADTMIFNLKPGAAGDGPVGSIAEDFEEPTVINGVRYSGITWIAADKSPGSRVQGWQAIRSRLNATVPNADGAREKAGLFVCEGVRSFFDYVIVLPRDLKNNKEDIPNKLNDHTADCIRYRLRHNTRPTVSFKRRWVA